jgi:hypothetical protein
MINTNIVAPSTTIDIQAPDEMLFNDVFLPEDAHEDLNDEPDMDDASFAAHSCNSSGSTPTTTPRSTPTTTPCSTPTTTSLSKPSTTPRSSPNTMNI